jgi:hypothetical protein
MKLIKLVLDMRRSSNLEGSFIVDDDEFKWLEALDGQEVYLGEVAGKHSEVFFTFEVSDLEILSQDEREIEIIRRLLGNSFGFKWKNYLFESLIERMYDSAIEDYVYDKITLEESLKSNGMTGIVAEKYTEIWKQIVQEESECES